MFYLEKLFQKISFDSFVLSNVSASEVQVNVTWDGVDIKIWMFCSCICISIYLFMVVQEIELAAVGLYYDGCLVPLFS
jgi:hypothetical protein